MTRSFAEAIQHINGLTGAKVRLTIECEGPPPGEVVQRESKTVAEDATRGHEGMLELRRLHRELDLAVRDAYEWDFDLGHDFHDVETLPENDRTRYTISPAARKEVLRRLLVADHVNP